ncbi:hypothetical protein LCGC14_2203420, partial [marine sediment metagenome]
MKKYAGKIMRWTLVSLFVFCLGVVCVNPYIAYAATTPAKTETTEAIAWTELTNTGDAAGIKETGTIDVSDSYRSTLHIDGKLQKITLPGEPGENGVTPKKGVDYFDGEDGYTPVKGKDYRDGKDGVTPKKDVDYKDGKDGVTPVKGQHYFDGKDAKPPDHRWNGTCLSFQNPDGTWGEEIDLKGKPGEKIKGDKGDSLAIEWMGTNLRIQNPDGSWSKWVDLKGGPGRDKKGDKGDKPV